MDEWKKINTNQPPENVVVECTTPSGDVVKLKRCSNLYFADGMYMYYIPVMWRLIK